MTCPVLSTLKKNLSLFLEKSWAIALSGGEDSCVLYHGIKSLFPLKEIVLIHVHHGIQNDADLWANFILRLGKHNKDRVIIKHICPEKKNEGDLRDLRYLAFIESMQEIGSIHDGVLFLAHHSDDQKETFLWRALRGAPFTQLLGMPFHREHQNFTIVRPLLSVSKKEILDYKAQHQIEHVIDPSNFKNEYYRNHLRNEVFKKLPFEDAIDTTLSYMHITDRAIEDLLHAQGYIWSDKHVLLCHHDQIHISRAILIILFQKWVNQHAHYPPSKSALCEFVQQIIQEKIAVLALKKQLYFYECKRIWTYSSHIKPLSDTYQFSTEGIEGAFGTFYIKIRSKSLTKKLTLRTIHKKEQFFLPYAPHKKRSAESLWKEFELGPQRRKFYPAVISESGEIYSYGAHVFLSPPQCEELFLNFKIEKLH